MLTWRLGRRHAAEEQAAAPVTNPGECSASSCERPAKLRCARCKFAYYCGKDCQTNHWNTHKRTCRAPGALPPLPGNFAIRVGPVTTKGGDGGNEKWKADLRREAMNDASQIPG